MSAVDRLASRLDRIERNIRAISTQPQLAYSSIDDGAVVVYVGDSLRQVVGQLPDGTVGALPVNAPPPPMPSTPYGEPQVRGFIVRWDGRNEDGSDVQPLDWARLEVHVSTSPLFEPSVDTLRGTIETPQGGEYHYGAGLTLIPEDDTFFVRFVARNTSGTPSLPSAVGTIAVGRVGSTDIADLSLEVIKFKTDQHLIY